MTDCPYRAVTQDEILVHECPIDVQGDHLDWERWANRSRDEPGRRRLHREILAIRGSPARSGSTTQVQRPGNAATSIAMPDS